MYIWLCGLLKQIDKTQLLFNVLRITWSWTEQERIHTESFMIRTTKSKSSRVTYKHASSLSPDEVKVFFVSINLHQQVGEQKCTARRLPKFFSCSGSHQAASCPALTYVPAEQPEKKAASGTWNDKDWLQFSFLKGSRKHLLKNQREMSKRTLPQEMLFPSVELWSPL